MKLLVSPPSSSRLATSQTIGGAFRSLTAQRSPEIYQPEGGNALYVFALAE